MATKPNYTLTHADLTAMFDYDHKTGRLIRRVTTGRSRAGTSSNVKDRDGYLVVGIKGKQYRAHRVVWFYVRGKWPTNDIDHINRVKDDNRIENLRDVTRSENKQNQGVSKTNKCGVKGVYFCTQSGKYRAEIGHNKQQILLGEFLSIEEAAAAYASAAKMLHRFNPVVEDQKHIG